MLPSLYKLLDTEYVCKSSSTERFSSLSSLNPIVMEQHAHLRLEIPVSLLNTSHYHSFKSSRVSKRVGEALEEGNGHSCQVNLLLIGI